MSNTPIGYEEGVFAEYEQSVDKTHTRTHNHTKWIKIRNIKVNYLRGNFRKRFSRCQKVSMNHVRIYCDCTGSKHVIMIYNIIEQYTSITKRYWIYTSYITENTAISISRFLWWLTGGRYKQWTRGPRTRGPKGNTKSQNTDSFITTLHYRRLYIHVALWYRFLTLYFCLKMLICILSYSELWIIW